jgi:hypothetical protein
MNRVIRKIIIHAVKKSESAAKPSSAFHYVISAYGAGYQKHDPRQLVTNTPAIDATAYHIKYVLDDAGCADKNYQGNIYQQETLYNHLLDVVNRFSEARVINAADAGIKGGIVISFDVKTWMKQYLPLLFCEMYEQQQEPQEELCIDHYEAMQAGRVRTIQTYRARQMAA